MNNSIDRNNPFDEGAPTLNMDLLSQMIRQQAQNRPIFENIAILGCGYVGSALADCWQERGHFVTGTTTSRERVASLAKTISKAVLMKGDDFTAVHSLLQGQDTSALLPRVSNRQMKRLMKRLTSPLRSIWSKL